MSKDHGPDRESSKFTTRPGLIFINILHTAFAPADPKSVKRYDDLTVFFTLSGLFLILEER